MAITEYRLKAVPVFAERVQGDLTQLVDIATRWGAEVRVHPETGTTLTLVQGLAPGAQATASLGDWLVDRTGEGRGVVSDEVFTASFEVAP